MERPGATAEVSACWEGARGETEKRLAALASIWRGGAARGFCRLAARARGLRGQRGPSMATVTPDAHLYRLPARAGDFGAP